MPPYGFPLVNPGVLADLAVHVAELVCDCLESDSVLGRPKDCFPVHGTPPDDCCDFLATWFPQLRPTRSFPNDLNADTASVRCGDVTMAADMTVSLMRPCYPALKDNPFNPFPPSAETAQAAQDLLIDARVMWCCLVAAAADGSIFPVSAGGPDLDCSDVWFGPMIPEGPRGGCAGWSITLSFHVGPCC